MHSQTNSCDYHVMCEKDDTSGQGINEFSNFLFAQLFTVSAIYDVCCLFLSVDPSQPARHGC